MFDEAFFSDFSKFGLIWLGYLTHGCITWARFKVCDHLLKWVQESICIGTLDEAEASTEGVSPTTPTSKSCQSLKCLSLWPKLSHPGASRMQTPWLAKKWCSKSWLLSYSGYCSLSITLRVSMAPAPSPPTSSLSPALIVYQVLLCFYLSSNFQHFPTVLVSESSLLCCSNMV